MTPALLRKVGECLYGTRWQSELARALGVTDRTMRRWVNGTHAIPAIQFKLNDMVVLRLRKMERLHSELIWARPG